MASGLRANPRCGFTDPTGNRKLEQFSQFSPLGKMTRPFFFLHNRSLGVGSWEGSGLGVSDSWQLRQSQKEMRAYSHVLTAPPVLGPVLLVGVVGGTFQCPQQFTH